jgi:hypothetical protein
LSNFYNLFELGIANLSSREDKLSSTTNRLGLFELLNLCITCGNELGLVRAILTLLAPRLPFLALSLFLLGLALVL